MITYKGNKPYEDKNFKVHDPFYWDDYIATNPNLDPSYVKVYLSLQTFLDKIFNRIQARYGYFIVVENFGIVKVNTGVENISNILPIFLMMQNSVILKDCWLRYAKDISSKAFEATENRCVYHQLAHFLLNPTSGKPTKFIDGNRMSEEALYKFLCKTYPSLKMDDGVSTFMVDLIGRETKRNVYAYDFNDQCFFRSVNNTDRNYCPIIFYRGNGHMYLIDTKEAFRSVVERNKASY